MIKLHDYQKDLLSKLDGFKPGELMIISAGRQTGKSMFNLQAELYRKMMEELTPYTKISTATVDGAPWYTIKCNSKVSEFIRTQSGQDKRWHEHIDSNWYVHKNMFDINEELYIQVGLKFGS